MHSLAIECWHNCGLTSICTLCATRRKTIHRMHLMRVPWNHTIASEISAKQEIQYAFAFHHHNSIEFKLICATRELSIELWTQFRHERRWKWRRDTSCVLTVFDPLQKSNVHIECVAHFYMHCIRRKTTYSIFIQLQSIDTSKQQSDNRFIYFGLILCAVDASL